MEFNNTHTVESVNKLALQVWDEGQEVTALTCHFEQILQ